MLTAAFVLAVIFGALATGRYEVSVLLTCATSLIIFAGGAQFLAVELVAGGAGAGAVIGAGVLLNARHVPYGLAVARSMPVQPWWRLLSCHVLTDEATAATLRFEDPERARRAYRVVAFGLFCFWNVGTLVGALAGQAVADAQALGLDAAFPASILALLSPHLSQTRLRVAAAAGAVVAVALIPALPIGAPVLAAAAAGLVVGTAIELRWRRA